MKSREQMECEVRYLEQGVEPSVAASLAKHGRAMWQYFCGVVRHLTDEKFRTDGVL